MFVWWLLGTAVQAAGYCTDKVLNVVVSAPADADGLAESLTCTGSARVTVEWHGRVKLNRTVNIGNGSSLIITGSKEAIIDGDGAVPLLTASDGATLELRTLSLENGQADQGGALFANGSFITIDDCNFSGNNGTQGGGECSSRLDLIMSWTQPLMRLCMPAGFRYSSISRMVVLCVDNHTLSRLLFF